MNKTQAIELVEIIKRLDEVFDEIEDFAKQLDNIDDAKAITKGLGMVIGEVYQELETPIYRKFPETPNRLDKEP